MSRRTLLVIFGPRTRLARALLTSPWGLRHDLVLVARDPAEQAWIAGAYPTAPIWPAWAPERMPATDHDQVVVVCCAMGLIHPRPPDLPGDAEDVRRDLRALERVVRARPDRAVHVLFVSSVLALVVVPGRPYYGGWKCVTEAVIAATLQSHPRARLSVLYPGRLVERAWPGGPLTLLSTTYRRLASIVARTIDAPGARPRVVGLDARLWLAWRALTTLGVAVVGRTRRQHALKEPGFHVDEEAAV